MASGQLEPSLLLFFVCIQKAKGEAVYSPNASSWVMLPPILNIPVSLERSGSAPTPLTCSLLVGLAVPIPTFPLVCCTTNCEVPTVRPPVEKVEVAVVVETTRFCESVTVPA